MFEGLISNYVRRLTPDLVYKYALSNNIVLTNEEAIIMTDYIKKNYQIILNNNNQQYIIDYLRKDLNDDLFEKAYGLLMITKARYGL